MIAASHSKTKPSRILLSTGVHEIGLKSLLMDAGRGTLFIGITLAHFHGDGTEPSLIDELKSEHIGLYILMQSS